MKKLEPDFKSFCLHVYSWNVSGVAWNLKDLRRLAKKYNTPEFIVDIIKTGDKK